MPRANYEITADGDMHDGRCTVPRCGFQSLGWPSRAQAQDRMRQHGNEHSTGEPAPELHEFRTGETHPEWTTAKKGR